MNCVFCEIWAAVCGGAHHFLSISICLCVWPVMYFNNRTDCTRFIQLGRTSAPWSPKVRIMCDHDSTKFKYHLVLCVFRCRRILVWTPNSKPCKEWPSPFTKTPWQHLNALGTRRSTMCSWWVLTQEWIGDLRCAIKYKKITPLPRDRFLFLALFTDRHNDSLISTEKALCEVFSLQFKVNMSQGQIIAKYKGIIVACFCSFLKSFFVC